MEGWKPTQPRGKHWSESKIFTSDSGEQVHLNYNAITSEHVIPLDYEDHIEDIICPPHGLYVRSNQLDLLPLDKQNAVVVFSTNFRCLGTHQPQHVGRRIVSFKQLRDDVVFMEGHEGVDPNMLIQDGKFEFVYVPATVNKQNQKRFETEFGEIDLNYDPDADGPEISYVKQNNFTKLELGAYAFFRAGLRCEFSWDWFSSSVSASVFAESRLYMGAELDISPQGNSELFNMVLWSKKIFGFSIPFFLFSVSADSNVDLSFKILTDHPDLNITASVNYEMIAKLENGAQYSLSTGYKEIKSADVSYNWNGLEASFQEVTFTFMVEPKITITLSCWFVEVRGSLAVQPYVDLELRTGNCAQQKVPDFQLYKGCNYSIVVNMWNPHEWKGELVPRSPLNDYWASGCIGQAKPQDASETQIHLQQIAPASIPTYYMYIGNGTFDCDGCDPYWLIKGGCPGACFEVQTTTMYNDPNPDWAATYIFANPSYSTFTLQLWDENPFARDTLLGQAVVRFSDFTNCTKWCTRYFVSNPVGTYQVEISFLYERPLYPSVQAGQWTTPSDQNGILEINLRGMEWVDDIVVAVTAWSGYGSISFLSGFSIPLDTSQPIPSNATDPYSWQQIGLFSAQSFENFTLYLDMQSGSADYLYSVLVLAAKKINSSNLNQVFDIPMLASSYFYFLSSFERVPWDTIAVDVSLPNTNWTSVITVYNSSDSILINATLTTGQTNTVWFPLQDLTDSTIELNVNSLNPDDTSIVHLLANFLPVYTRPAFGQPISISCSIVDPTVLFEVPLPQGTTSLTIQFSKVIDMVTVYNISHHATLDDSMSYALQSNSTFTLSTLATSHLVLELNSKFLNGTIVTFYPLSNQAASGTSTMLTQLYDDLYYQVPLLALNTTAVANSPIAVINLQNVNFHAAIEASSSISFPNNKSCDWAFSGNATAITAVASFPNTRSADLNFHFGISSATNFQPFLKITTGWSIAVQQDIQFLQQFPASSVTQLAISFPSTYFGLQVICNNTQLHGTYFPNLTAIPYQNSMSFLANGHTTIWADIAASNATVCNLAIRELKKPAWKIEEQFIDVNSIRTGNASITMFLSNDQYSFNYLLFKQEYAAVNLLSSFVSSLGTSPTAWLRTVRPALLQNATACLENVSTTKMRIRIPAVPQYDPETNEVVTLILPDLAILPSTPTAMVYSVTLGNSSTPVPASSSTTTGYQLSTSGTQTAVNSSNTESTNFSMKTAIAAGAGIGIATFVCLVAIAGGIVYYRRKKHSYNGVPLQVMVDDDQ